MSDKENLKNDEQQVVSPEGRRSFLKKASIAAPIVVASSAKPAWATTTDIACMSGVMSGNLSGRARHCDATSTNAKSPFDWKPSYAKGYNRDSNKVQKRKAVCNKVGVNYVNGTQYKSDIASNYYFELNSDKWILIGAKRGSTIDNKKLKDLLNGTAFEKEIAAAMLNAKAAENPETGVGYPYSSGQVLEIYLEVAGDDSKEELVTQMLEGIRTGNSLYASEL